MNWIKRQYRTIKYQINNWFYYHSWIYIGLNPFKFIQDYWKVRKYFQKPIIIKHKMKPEENMLGSDYLYIYTNNYNKLIHLSFHSCDWKSKYQEIRFETVPYICFIWLGKVKYIWGLEAPIYSDSNWSKCHSRNNDLYWEGILTFLYKFDKDVIKTYRNNIWVSTYLSEFKPKDQEKPDRVEIRHTLIDAFKPKYSQLIIEDEYKRYKEIKENERSC